MSNDLQLKINPLFKDRYLAQDLFGQSQESTKQLEEKIVNLEQDLAAHKLLVRTLRIHLLRDLDAGLREGNAKRLLNLRLHFDAEIGRV